MGDDTEENDSEDEVLTLDELKEEIETLAESSTAYYTPKSIQFLIESGQIGVALLLTATRCENVLAELVKDRFSLTDDQFDNLGWRTRSLGTYYNMCRQTDVEIVKEYEDEIGRFIGKRNTLAHQRGYYEELQQHDDEEQEEVTELIEEMTQFLAQAPV